MYFIRYEDIRDCVNKLKSEYGSGINPEKLAGLLGIGVLYLDMGEGDSCVKGFAHCEKRVSVICVNKNLPTETAELVILHEIGHILLHKKAGKPFDTCDMGLFDLRGEAEQEANCFAAEYLLTDEDVKEAVALCDTAEYIAKSFNMPPEVLQYKIKMMCNAGNTDLKPARVSTRFMGKLSTEEV